MKLSENESFRTVPFPVPSVYGLFFIVVFAVFSGNLFLLFGRKEFVENRNLHFLIRFQRKFFKRHKGFSVKISFDCHSGLP